MCGSLIWSFSILISVEVHIVGTWSLAFPRCVIPVQAKFIEWVPGYSPLGFQESVAYILKSLNCICIMKVIVQWVSTCTDSEEPCLLLESGRWALLQLWSHPDSKEAIVRTPSGHRRDYRIIFFEGCKFFFLPIRSFYMSALIKVLSAFNFSVFSTYPLMTVTTAVAHEKNLPLLQNWNCRRAPEFIFFCH